MRGEREKEKMQQKRGVIAVKRWVVPLTVTHLFSSLQKKRKQVKILFRALNKALLKLAQILNFNYVNVIY